MKDLRERCDQILRELLDTGTTKKRVDLFESFASEIRNEALEEAALFTVEKGKSVKGGYNNACHEIAEGIRTLALAASAKED